MDVSQFLGGSLMTHTDLPQPYQVGTITKVEQRLVGQGQQAETKICCTFQELPQKALGLNKTNLRRIAELYGTDASQWQGKQLLVYRSATEFQGQRKLCVRVCGSQQSPADTVCDAQGSAVAYQPAVPAPAAVAPTTQTAPVQAPASQPVQSDPWQGQ